jgi:glutaminase
MNYQPIIESVYREVKGMEDPGKLATYIPELAKVSPDKFGVFVASMDGTGSGFGDSSQKFSIQSIAKVLSLSMVYAHIRVDVWDRVGVEPSGRAFNSLTQLEDEHGIPRNPLINAGAIVICDMLISNFKNPKQDLLDYVRQVSKNPELNYNEKIAHSERQVGFRNRAMVNLMKSFGNIENDTIDVLDLYFNLCSIEMSCEELASTFLYLANDGLDPVSGKQWLSLSQSKRVNAIMMTCGFYDEAGEFAFRVGLPGKSGVGGGIVAIHPDEYVVAVWSPRLNLKGNSFKGMKFLEIFTTKTGQSVL